MEYLDLPANENARKDLKKKLKYKRMEHIPIFGLGSGSVRGMKTGSRHYNMGPVRRWEEKWHIHQQWCL